jgi:hypothetical protein
MTDSTLLSRADRGPDVKSVTAAGSTADRLDAPDAPLCAGPYDRACSRQNHKQSGNALWFLVEELDRAIQDAKIAVVK